MDARTRQKIKRALLIGTSALLTLATCPVAHAAATYNSLNQGSTLLTNNGSTSTVNNSLNFLPAQGQSGNNANQNFNYGTGDADFSNKGNTTLQHHLSITSVEWQAIADMTTHEIDPVTMELITNLSYTFIIHPSLLGPNQNLSLPDGKYLLRVAVMLSNGASQRFSNFNGLKRKLKIRERLISWTQEVVTVSGGKAVAEITLPFRNSTALTVMNELLLELSPLKDNGIAYQNNGKIELLSVRPTILKGPFFASREGHIIGSANKNIVKPQPKKYNSLSRYIADAELHRATLLSQQPRYGTTAESAKAFATDNHLTLLTTKSPEVKSILNSAWSTLKGKEDFLALFNTPNSEPLQLFNRPIAVFSLCSLMAQRLNKPMTLFPMFDCQANPKRYLRVAKNLHVGSVASTRPETIRRQQRFVVSGNFMVSRSKSDDVYSSATFSPLTVPFKILEAFGIPVPFSYNYTLNQSNSRTTAENMILSNTTQMDVNTITARIQLKRFRTCLSVQPANNAVFYDARQPGAGYYICNSEDEKNTEAIEEYAQIYERLNDSTFLDTLSASAQGVNFNLRGDRDLLAFFYAIRMAQTPNHNSTYTSNDALEAAQNYLISTRSTTPGVIAVPVELSNLTYGAPTFWEKLFGQYQENFLTAVD